MSRKRLTPLDPDLAADLRADASARTRQRPAAPGLGGPAAGTPPIARIAGEVGRNIEDEISRLRNENAALAGKGAALDAAEAEGRVVVRLPLDQIDAYAMLRDRHRLDRDGEEWTALKASLAERGQQTPVEVIAQDGAHADAHPGSYALVTGLRRVSALAELLVETGDERFATVLAFIRPQAGDADKLRAMVEENEIRQDISFYERGRVVALAASEGVFASLDAAIAGLFVGANRNKRYKIRAFAHLYEALGDTLSFPEAIGERLGLDLVRRLRESASEPLRAILAEDPPQNAAAELAILTDFAKSKGVFAQSIAPTPAKPVPMAAVWQGTDGARIKATCPAPGAPVTVTFEGVDGLDPTSLETLVGWLGNLMQPPPR